MNLSKKLEIVLAAFIVMIMTLVFCTTFSYAENENSETEQWKWVTNEDGTRYENKDDYAKSKWLKIDGYYYYFNDDGYIQQNCYVQGYWLNEEGKWIEAYSNGQWKKNSIGKWYEDKGWYPVNRWLKVDGNYYHFNENGYMEKGCYVDGYWINSDGLRSEEISNGEWIVDEGGTKYGDNGWSPKSQWLKINGYYYYFNDDGHMQRNCYVQGCWLDGEGKWIRANSNGKWKKNSIGWWYEDNRWYPVSTWLYIDGKAYYFNSYGYMEASSYVDGCWLDQYGAWNRNYSNGKWKKNSTGWWYEDNGWYPVNQSVRIDCKEYYFDRSGYMVEDYIYVSLSEQMLYYYKNGSLNLKTQVVTGRYGKYDTPTGMYRIGSKSRGIYLTGPGYRSYVNYWMPFIGNQYGFHDAGWRSYFGGNIYLTNGSHGCVNLPFGAASRLFSMIGENKTYVIIK